MAINYDSKSASERVWQRLREKIGATKEAPDPLADWERLATAPIGLTRLHEFLDKSSLNFTSISRNVELDMDPRVSQVGKAVALNSELNHVAKELARIIRTRDLKNPDHLVTAHVRFVETIARAIPESMLIHGFVGYHELPKLPDLRVGTFFEVIQPRIMKALSYRN